ncbi:hypothetical protein OPV22_008843 [Ensete ventricosum]|uniref:Uncharacterized protein n=1 Tax=Ensete ventricosum TaxID=4639 RepID=A0AAV8RDP2_ENSVE|nr:hypothetical protein OPV22_008843 [Ensete ventricosum]
MDKNSSREKELVIDLEGGETAVIREQEGSKDTWCSAGQDNGMLSRVWSSFISIEGPIKGERVGNSASSSVELHLIDREALGDRSVGLEAKMGLLEKKVGLEITKKKGCKKPPKPPRPPNSLPSDAANQKLMKEISEIAMMKRARIERMKKKVKDANSARINGNLWALIVTILFVLVIIWQGVLPRGSSSGISNGHAESSVETRGGLISIHFYKNASGNTPQASTSMSPNSDVEPASG